MPDDRMTPPDVEAPAALTRRQIVGMGTLLGSAALAGPTAAAFGQAGDPRDRRPAPPDARARSAKTYDMKKSINMWAFPYPQRMSLRECFALAARAGFDGIEVNYDLKDDLCPDTPEDKLKDIGKMARDLGLAVSGVCSFLFWPYSLTSNDANTRARGMELARRMIRAARLLGTENLLIVPGAVYIPWLPDSQPVDYAVALQRAAQAVRDLLPDAQRERVYLNVENIFMNGFLLSPDDLVRFVDAFNSPWVRVHFDTGNIMQVQFPEHWIPILGPRIKNVHLKEFTKKGTDWTLTSFRPLLDGTTDWPAVIEAFDQAGYRGYLTFEYFRPFLHYPEALIYQASDALDRLLGRTPRWT
jgi:hexulose-6-phosphate isomerase